ncbi:terminase family protein [Salmonella enterica]|nr:terminase family protein [Salmonella enterica]
MDELEALEGITADQILAIPEDERAEFIKNAIDYINYRRYNKLDNFSPYPYQIEFIKDGARYKKRFLRTGNRMGKTFGGAAEMATHLTGRYPADWKGAVIKGSGRIYWCVGITHKLVKDVQQKALLGTANITMIEDIGTGAIPRDAIILDRGIEKDGAQVLSIQIKHVDGGSNTLKFLSCQNPDSFMGAECSMIWIDEESPNSMEIYSHCSARLINALGIGDNGLMIITATPEQGDTALNQLFTANKGGELKLRSATWWDCPRFTVEQIERDLAQLPPWQRDVRAKGLPFIGHGAVFPFSDDDLLIEDVQPQDHWEVIAGIDWGNVQDPTVIIIALRDPDTETFYLYDMFYFDETEEDRSAVNVAQTLLTSRYANVPVIIPHDSGLKSDASVTKGKILQRHGVNVKTPVFHNPPSSLLRVPKYGNISKAYNDIATGLEEMILMMREGRFKVCSRCYKWMVEKRSYAYAINERTGTIAPKGKDDHCIDASRYAVLSLLGNRGGLWVEALAPSFAGAVEPPQVFF